MESFRDRWHQKADALGVKSVEHHDQRAQPDGGDLKPAEWLLVDNLSDGKRARLSAHDRISTPGAPGTFSQSCVSVRVHWNPPFYILLFGPESPGRSLAGAHPPPRNHGFVIYVYGIRAAAKAARNSPQRTSAMAKKLSVDRRKFLKGAAAGAAGFVAAASSSIAAPQALPARSATAPMMPKELHPSGIDGLTTERTGSHLMVYVIKSLGLEYVASNPGSSFRALHESLINYGGNESPEFITCCHEESSVGLAHGYAKVEGKPMGVLVHSNVGLQHGSMAIFNAYCDRAPVYIIAGNSVDATMRRPGVEWDHSVQDVAAMVRDFVKWDDLPASLPHFAESAVRAYKIAMTTPMMPVLIVADADLQESPISKDAKIHIPKLT